MGASYLRSVCFTSFWVVFAAPGIVRAQVSNGSNCQSIVTAVDDAEKDMSMLAVGSALETSAAREASRQQQIGNDLALISLNLTLAAQAHCPARPGPIKTTAYFLSATACIRVGADAQLAATRAGTSPPSQLPPECDQRTWKRDPEKP